MKKQFGESLDDNASVMLDRVISEMPLRSMVLLSGGKLTWTALDRTIKIMNRWPGRKR